MVVMKILYFIYFSIASLMPKKAMLGKWQASCTLLFIFTYLLVISILLCFQQLIHFKPANTKLFVYLFYGGFGAFLFIFLRIIILKPLKLINLRNKFSKIPKWKLKLTGILYIIFSYVMALGLMIIANKM
jgi:hypothetical protein